MESHLFFYLIWHGLSLIFCFDLAWTLIDFYSIWHGRERLYEKMREVCRYDISGMRRYHFIRYFHPNTPKTGQFIRNYEKPRQSTHWKRNHPDWCSDAINHNCTESKASTLNLVSASEEPGNASTTGNGHSSSKRQEQQSGYTGGTAGCKHPRKTGIAGQHRKKKRQPQKWQCCARTPASSTTYDCHLCTNEFLITSILATVSSGYTWAVVEVGFAANTHGSFLNVFTSLPVCERHLS